MALINCPECGKQISDKSSVCIHCGYPISTMQEKENNLFDMTINSIGGAKSFIVAVLKNFGIQKAEATKLLDKNGSIILGGIKEENVQYIKEHFEADNCSVSFIPSKHTEPNPLNDTWYNYTYKFHERRAHIPHCPTCGSTNIKTISFTRKAVGVATLGIFSKSARSQFQCKDCGYKW
ncbi:MAG: zinc ribbon domain-containing protein [Candidatus Gastranaerophilales bacterium]|nr:zinc ribbon domain-containing protein [Candidatus Gastranaerophilales bacterium]